MATFDSDAFTDTTGTLLSAHTPTAGGSWAICTGTTNTARITSGGRTRNSFSAGEADYLCQGTPGSADYTVQADLWAGSSAATNYAGLYGRSDPSGGQNGTTGKTYLSLYDGGAPGWLLTKAVNNTFTQLGSTFSQSLTLSTSTTFKMTMTGTSLVLNVAGTDRVTTTDSAVTAAGQAGVFILSSSLTDNTALELDNFSATDAVTASTFPPLPAVWHNPLLPM
jgi:hypothetical protein